MGQNKKNFSPVKKGMNRSTAPYLLEGVEYLFALNTNIQDGEHSIINITNEESNVLAAKFKEGYKVIGKNNDNLTKSTYFFLANNEGDSELGVIKNNQIENNDVLEDLEKPLEEIEQQPYQHYESIIEKGLNLNINYPVKSIIKNEASGKVIAFTDNLNPPRLIKLDKLDEYLIGEKEVDTEKINIFPKTNQPKINVKPVVTGGRLKRGTYQFLIAYTNSLGQEIGEYTSITNPIPIFDPNNVVMQDSEIANRTNFAIKLDITHLDTTKDYYKIVVIQNTDIEGGLSYFVEGIHPITDNTVIYSTEENKERITLEEILTPFPTVKRWEGLTQTNGHLIGNGIEEEKEINLQPVVNLMGPFLKWQTSIARETLYQSPDDNALSKGYMRNEVYPFSIRFNFNNGYKTALFPLINRPAKYFEFPENNQIYHELDNVPDSKDVQSIKEVSPTFSNTNREKIWQYYNTATSSGNLKLNNVDYTSFQEPVIKTSLVEDVGIIPKPDNYITLKLAYEPFTTLEDFLEDNFERYRDKSHPLNFIFEAFNPNNYKDQHKIPDFEECKEPQLLGERDEIIVGEIENEEVNFIKRNIDEYRRVSTDVAKDLYVTYMDGDDKRAIRQEPDATETNKVIHDVTEQYRFEKIEPPTNNDRQYVLPLHRFNLDLSATKNITTLSFSNDLEVRRTKEEIFTPYRSRRYYNLEKDTTLPVEIEGLPNGIQFPLPPTGYFASNVSINALWFSSEFAEDEEIKIVEIPKIAPETKIKEIFSNNNYLRVTVFNDCTDVYDEDCNEYDPIMYYLVDASKGDIREFVKADMKGVSGGREGRSNQNTDGGRDPGNAGTPTPRETQREGRGRSNQPQEERGSRSENNTEGRTVDLYGHKFLIAVDTVYAQMGTMHIASGFKGKYSIHERPLEYGSVKVMFDAIHLDKRETYRADCNFRIPQVDEFEVLPFERGDFGYVESEENYPNNEELFNSSKLKIDLKKIPEEYKQEFKDYYIKTNPDGTYELNEETNFVNKPIRHFKFPDNDIAPFMSETRLAAFSESMIFPLGIYIDDKVVNSFLDIAVDNDLLTPEQRDNITSYEIFRGDRTLEKSIVAKGLLYDNYKYTEEDDEVYFPNFPFNTLGENHLLYTNDNRDTYIQHPYDSEENNSFTFISPDNQFRKLSPATELQLEGFQLGNSKGYFSQVEDHPKWTILGDKGYRLATTLAIAETTAEVAIQIAEATIETSKNMWITLGLSSGGNPIGTGVGTIATGVIAGFQILSNSIFKVGRYRHQWLQTFRDLGQPENFASYYTGVGHYNSLLRVPYFGNKIRAINTTKELNSGRFTFRHNDTGERVVFNNKDRERSTYIYLGKDFALEYPYEYYSYDNIELNRNLASRNIASEENACSTNQTSEIIGNVASPYVSLKNYIPSQYGTLNSIKWLPTGHLSHFENSNKTIFGGDIYLSRMTVKRKMPLFLRDAMKVPDLTPFNYGFYTNVGDARFFVNYEVSEEVNIENSIFPEFRSEYNLDCGMSDKGFYLKPPSKFYLYYYGIVDFLVESDINTNFRYAKPDLRDDFYPHVGDVVEWTQETNVSIKEQNKFYYNFIYSQPSIVPNYRTLPFTFSKEEYDKRYDNKNNVMWSLPDNSEVDLSEPWTTFRAYDRHNFPTSYGKLVDLKGIESGRILGRFTNQTAIFNAVDLQVDGINSNYGDGHLFSRPPRTFTETDLGYLGTQSSQMVSNEFGHFFVDTERGAVFRIDPAGEGMKEISKYSSDSITGMDKWFKKHLPFKILNPLINNYEEIDLDNPYSKVGITMGWDNKYKRVFITKKDYIPLKEMNYDNKNFFAAKDEHELITDYEADGYTYLGREDYFYKFSKNIIDIPKTTPIYVLVNVNDFTIEEAQEIKEEVKEWANDIEDYEGNIIFISTDSNRLLKNTNDLLEKKFNSLYRQGRWNTFSTYNNENINKEGIFIHFTNSSSYENNLSQYISDHNQFINNFREVDYLRNLIITKDSIQDINNILNASNEYKDQPIPGTNPQRFIEPLRTYGYSYMPDFNLDTQRFLNTLLGDEFKEEIILIKGDVIDVTDTEFFKDVSFTIAYSVETESWLSFYSFQPNYYISHNTYFQTGIEDSLWSHNISDKSYGVFYGEKQPWIIEYPIKNEYMPKRLQNITFWTEAKRFNEAYDKDITFNKAVIYNTYGNSGQLNLVPQKTLRQISKYPINRGTSQDILINYQDFKWTLNNIYDRTLNDGYKKQWIYDENEINKEINSDLVQFGGKKILSYLRGEYFIVRLTYDNSTEHNIIFKWGSNTEEVYQ